MGGLLMVTANPFMPSYRDPNVLRDPNISPAAILAQRRLQFGGPDVPQFVDGKYVPTTDVRQTQEKMNIKQQLESQARKTRRAAKDARSSAWFGLGTTILGGFLGPLGSLALGAASKYLGPQAKPADLTKEQEEIESLTAILSAGAKAPGVGKSTYLTNVGDIAVTRGQKTVAKANEYAAKQAEMTGYVNLGTTLIGMAQAVKGAWDAGQKPMPKPGMEHAVAEQTAIGLKPGKDLMTTPAKEFLDGIGIKNETLMEQATKSLEGLPDSQPGVWGHTEFIDKSLLEQGIQDPLYPDRTWLGTTINTDDMLVPPPSKVPMIQDPTGKWVEVAPYQEYIPQPVPITPLQELAQHRIMYGQAYNPGSHLPQRPQRPPSKPLYGPPVPKDLYPSRSE